MRFIGIFLFAAAMTAALADPVYKWVDKDGHVHYSQTPPASTGVQAQKQDIQGPQTSSMDPILAQQLSDQAEAARTKNAQDQRQAQQEAQKKAQLDEYCNQLRSRLTVYQRAGRVFTVDAQGNRNYISDEEHQRAIQQLQDEIARKCAGNSS